MPALYLPDALMLPTEATGIAPFRGRHANSAALEVGRYFGAWCPSVSRMQLGSTLRDLRGRNDAEIQSATQPSAWGPDELSQFNQPVLKYTADVSNTELLIGDVLDFRFLVTDQFTTVSCFSFTDLVDDRCLVNKFGSNNRRCWMVRVNPSGQIEVFHQDGSASMTGTLVLSTDTWYTVIVSSNGDSSDSTGLVSRVYTDGELVETDTTNPDSTNESTLTEPIELWGRGTSDNMLGLAGNTFFYKFVLSEAASLLLANDNLAPMRREALLIPTAAPVTTTPLEHISFSRRDRIDPIRMM